jgi:hypothetical protein
VRRFNNIPLSFKGAGMEKSRQYLEFVLLDTATSLKRSMDAYWSADEGGKYDLPESNVSLHFAHQLLCRGFHVYAEANHPEGQLDGRKIQGIDMLAISPDRKWWLACEFKKYIGSNMTYSMDDLNRVATFQLNKNLDPDQIGHMGLETVELCTKGIGLVAGMTWAGGQNPQIKFSRSERHRTFVEKLEKRGGQVLEPILVRQYQETKAKGAYFLLAAIIDNGQDAN